MSLNRLGQKATWWDNIGASSLVMRTRGAARYVGETPVRRAFRSPVFRYTVELDIPDYVWDEIHGTTTTHPSVNGDPFPRQQLEVRIDLKERHIEEQLYGQSSNVRGPPWKRNKVVGSVHLPLDKSTLKYLLTHCCDAPTKRGFSVRRSTLVNETMDSSSTSYYTSLDHSLDEAPIESAATNKPDGCALLRFVRKLDTPLEVR